ncbi:hypothetical protein V2W30_08570 [Streptomyces sp. Q6]|uniref:Uncharacterized protein n=1 Tax=Streptomyces citrinus TaxID=3118173 RepID=A0ACD5A857_9ACTN
MRPAEEQPAPRSATPIYDALYAEYRRSFRSLPGDRTGEEDLGFTAFGAGSYGTRQHGTPYYPTAQHHWNTQHTQHTPYAQHTQTSGRQHGQGSHFPAALPPGPRHEL